METTSQTTRRRIKPALLHGPEDGPPNGHLPAVTSPRGLRNLGYEQRAIATLADDPKLAWLGIEAAGDGAQRRRQRTIMQQLGRIPDRDAMRRIAERICQLQPKTRQAIAMIRDFRSHQAGGSPLELANLLIRTLNAYLDGHRTMTFAKARDALRIVTAQLDRQGD